MTTAEIIDYYKNLLIVQYAVQPRAIGTVGAFVAEIIASQIISQVRDAFNLNVAIGDQLDILGEYRGAPRVVFGTDFTRVYMAMPTYSNPSISAYKGFADYSMSDNDITWYFLRYQDINQIPQTLNDSEYRGLIKFKAAVQSSSLGVGEIDLILQSFFGTYVTMTDNENMTVTFNDSPFDPSDLFQIVEKSGSLPKPAGVQLIITNV